MQAIKGLVGAGLFVGYVAHLLISSRMHKPNKQSENRGENRGDKEYETLQQYQEEMEKKQGEMPEDSEHEIQQQYQEDIEYQAKSGALHVFTGPMFCGKTTRLIKEIVLYADLSGRAPLLINHIRDTRDNKNIVSSHSSQFLGLSSKIKTIAVDCLLSADVSDYDVIGIDEAQFFNDLVAVVRKWVRAGKQVYCSGLDSDFKMQTFGQINQLLPLSDTFTKMQGLCHHCLRDQGSNVRMDTISKASFTGKISRSGKIIEIGASDLYVAVCRYHHQALHRQLYHGGKQHN